MGFLLVYEGRSGASLFSKSVRNIPMVFCCASEALALCVAAFTLICCFRKDAWIVQNSARAVKKMWLYSIDYIADITVRVTIVTFQILIRANPTLTAWDTASSSAKSVQRNEIYVTPPFSLNIIKRR